MKTRPGAKPKGRANASAQIVPPSKRPRPRTAAQHIFVTGYPGFIAKRLVRTLLTERPRSRITVLVEEAKRAIAQAEIAMLGPVHADRIHLAGGDVTKMDAGLAGPEIAALADVTHVFHLAGVQRFDAPASLFESVNVDGTRNVLALAREMGRLERFVHFSTCLVSGDREGVVTEEELDVGQRFRTPYEGTKARGEKLARTAMRDLPITVIRPSIVVGSSDTGEVDRFDGPYQIALLVVTSPMSVPLPLPGTGTAPLHLVPVDFVTRAAAQLAFDPRARGGTFHVVDPNPLSARYVYELIALRAGKKLPGRTRGSTLASRLVTLPGLERLSRRQIPKLSALDRFVLYNCAGTLALLDGTGIMCPRFETYVDKLTAFVTESLRQQRLAKPTPSADPLDS